MIRSWGLITLGASSQPWFGDVTTASVALPDSFGKITLTVGSTTRYQAGDRVLVAPQTATQDVLKVDSIASPTILNCQSEGNAKTHTHPTNTQLMLDIACSLVVIQMPSVTGNTATNSVWLGSDNTVGLNGSGSAFYQLFINQDSAGNVMPSSYVYGQSSDFNTLRTSDGWMFPSIAGVKISISAIVI